MENFYLFAFLIKGKTIVTRGRDQEEALKGVSRGLPRGMTIALLNDCPINAAKAYSTVHPFDWLHQVPQWLKDKTT